MCDCPTKYDEMKIHPLRPFPSVFLEVGTEVRKWGIIEIELFTDTPKTCENFRQLCTGEAGIGE
jgi:hypothetical protein